MAKIPNRYARKDIKNLLSQGVQIIIPDNYYWTFYKANDKYYMTNPDRLHRDVSFIAGNIQPPIETKGIFIQVTENNFYQTLWSMIGRFTKFLTTQGQLYFVSSISGEIINITKYEK